MFTSPSSHSGAPDPISFISTPTSKPDSITRIIFQNLNGISHYNLSNTTRDFLADCDRHSPDIICFCEHNLSLTSAVKDQLSTAVRRHYKRARLVISDSPTPTATPFKPGGTGIILLNKMADCVDKQYQDPLGRWTCCTL